LNQLFLWSDTDSQPWVVRESRRARRLAVRVHRTGRVEVVVPPRTSRAAVSAFLAQHRTWIETRREAALRQKPPEVPFPPGEIRFAAVYETWRVHLAGCGSASRRTNYWSSLEIPVSRSRSRLRCGAG